MNENKFNGFTPFSEPVKHLLFHCGALKQGEKVTILSDPDTSALAFLFEQAAGDVAGEVTHLVIEGLTRHGQEPTDQAAMKMASSDLILSLCTWSLAHSKARVEAAGRGARFLSLPFYSEELMADPAVMLNYSEQRPLVEQVASLFTGGSAIRLYSDAGTDLHLDITGRRGNACPGIVEFPGELGSPPDVEAHIAPLETKSEGVVCIDGSITCEEIGLLSSPVWLHLEKGRITTIRGSDKKVLDTLESMLGPADSPRRVLAECGVGLNPLARLTGSMLTDEGSLGSVHLGFGSNSTIGGINTTDFHLDFVFKRASLSVDSKNVLDKGELVLK